MDTLMIQAGWLSLLPPVIAIALALITKEVYSSLLTGVFAGMLIYCGCSGQSFLSAVTGTLDLMAAKLGENSYMILFLALLGALVVVVTRAGGSRAYGRWAAGKLKSPRAVKLSTVLLGMMIFIDDYFNCLTVGTVMRPVTDKHRIPREKLAYLIDSTAAPICIIAPISSWAVAVSSELEAAGGLNAFFATIPYNFYAFITLLMVLVISLTDFDFGPMKLAALQVNASAEDDSDAGDMSDMTVSDRGTVLDLVLPMLMLIICSILGMAYVGGFFRGVSFAAAIGENPTAGLTLGAFTALIFALLMYVPRKLISFKEFMESINQGVKFMVGAILILVLAWSLSGVCREMLGTGEFVSALVQTSNIPLHLLPAIVFLVAAFLSFSMGTAWGTFGILLPIVGMICTGPAGAAVLMPSLGATLAGSVFGDHCSPISDTTILSSAGAKCEHIRHVETQIPYSCLVAGVCFVGYLIAGLASNPWVPLICSAALLLMILYGISLLNKAFK